MNKTKIEWCDYTINPVKGLCPMACSYCYARRMYKRFKWDEKIRLDIPAIHSVHTIKSPSRIFVGSTMELFGNWIPDDYYDYIWGMVKAKPQHTFIFLTKQPQNLAKWSPFPGNCWVGVSATLPEEIRLAFKHLRYDVQAKVKFVSFEPMLGMILPFESKWFTASGVNWIIIGQQTPVKTSTMPKIEWVRDMVEAADRAGVPVFLKDNMMPLLKDCIGVHAPYWRITDPDNIWPYARLVQLRQEFPNGCGK